MDIRIHDHQMFENDTDRRARDITESASKVEDES